MISKKEKSMIKVFFSNNPDICFVSNTSEAMALAQDTKEVKSISDAEKASKESTFLFFVCFRGEIKEFES